jgi:hypothetical protein
MGDSEKKVSLQAAWYAHLHSLRSRQSLHKSLLARVVWPVWHKITDESAYHPQSDGQTKWVNQSLEMYLWCAANAHPQKWFTWLPLAEFWYNTSHYSAIGCSPFKTLYKEEPHYGMLPHLNTTTNTEVIDFLTERQSVRDLLKYHLERAQLRLKHYTD